MAGSLPKVGLTIIALAAVLCAGCNRGDLKKDVEELQLDNGMRWLLVRKGYAPIFAGVFQVKVGGVDEIRGKTGIAHMLEHMAYKGTSSIGPEELWDILVRNGAVQPNAYTSKDVTTYFIEMPNSKLELWLYLISEMMSNPSFAEFDIEKKVVLEEFKTSIDNSPTGRLYEKLVSSAYGKSPYGWLTIGVFDDVKNLGVEDVKKFYKAHYMPECMVAAIVGDINIKETTELIHRYFDRFRGEGATCRRTIRMDPPQLEESKSSVEFDAEPLLVIAFHKPTVPNLDDYVFDIFSYLLCGRESSRMEMNLVKEKKIAKKIECANSFPGSRLPNLFIIHAEPYNAGSLDKLEAAILEELDRLKNEPVGPKELEKVKNQMKAAYLFAIDSNFELAHMLADAENVIGSWEYVLNHPKNIEEISTDDIIEAAKRYFVPRNMTVTTLRRKGE